MSEAWFEGDLEYEHFESTRFRPASLDLIEKALHIIKDMRAQGYDLTLRQLYYQFVKNNWLRNTPQNYDNLGKLVTNARLAGKLPWNVLEDRNRSVYGLPHSSDPAEILRSVPRRYYEDWWIGQPLRVEVWIEKDALSQIVSLAANEWNVRYMACKGFMSLSEMHTAARRIQDRADEDIRTVILHLGDHDPSGLDMTRDIRERLAMLTRFEEGAEFKVDRIALSMEQVYQYRLPPNPAKQTDARYQAYAQEYGASSWELDGMAPGDMRALISENISALVLDEDLFENAQAQEKANRGRLTKLARHWRDVEKYLDTLEN